jgi:D-alanyl-D-alanine dipeptidase
MHKYIYIIILFFFFSFTKKESFQVNKSLPPGFVYLSDYISDFKLDLCYATSYNFVGKPINGYKNKVCIVTKDCAIQLKKINEELKKYDLALLIYDAYRPQKAVNDFVKWAKNTNDTLMKSEFYPNIVKSDLFSKGFISSKSRHSSGSTVDLTLFSLKYNQVLDMGSPYDFFGEKSFVNHQNLNKTQKYNRLFLQQIMQKYNFRSYLKEWWHFTLKNEPYHNHYFNFDVK